MPAFTDTPLHGVAYSDALKEAWAHADSSVVIHTTLELSNDAFVDENGAPYAARVVRDFVDLVATLEADAPMNPGDAVTFTALPFEFTRPAETDAGAPAAVGLSLDNVSRELARLLDQTQGSLNVTTVTLREYLSTDTSAPHNDPPLVLELQGATVSLGRVEARAAFGGLANERFPADIYDAARFPGLGAR
jgi:hypothetical protein